MPLPPLSFNVPQPRRSIIEEALGVALANAATQFISAPFERKRDRARAELERELLPGRLAIEREDLSERLKLQSQAQIASIVPTLMERIRAQAISRAEMAKIPMTPGGERILDIAQKNLGVDPATIAAPTNLAELDEMSGLLQPAISSGQLAADVERNRLTGEYNRDIRLANLYAPLGRQDIEEFGNIINTVDGNLLSYRDIQLLKTGAARLQQVPEAKGDLARLNELDELRRTGKLRAVTLDRNAFSKVLQEFKGMEAGQLMSIYGQAYPFLLYTAKDGKSQRIDAGNVGRLSVFMQGNPDLLDALAAYRLARSMNDVMDAEKANGLKFSRRTLGYLSLMFKAAGQPYEHPDAEIPSEIPDEVIHGLGVTRVQPASPGSPRQGASLGNPLDPSNQGSVIPPARGSLFTGLDISSEQQNPGYLRLQQGVQTRLRAKKYPGVPYDTAAFRMFSQDFVNRHTTPEAALAWYRSLGEPDEKLRDLIEGTEESKKLALHQRLSFALGALQNARDAILAR